MKVHEYTNSPQFNETRTKRTYTRSFMVELTDPLYGPRTALDAVGINYGEQYQYNGEWDLAAYVKSRKADRDKSSPRVWKVVIVYEAEIKDGENGNGDDPGEDQPEDNEFVVDQVVSWAGTARQEAALKDNAGNAILNAAGDQFDPPLMVEKIQRQLTISRNERREGPDAFQSSIIDDYQGKENSAAFFGFGIGEVLCTNIRAEQNVVNGFLSFRVTYQFLCDADGFDLEPLEYGANCINDAGKKVRCTDEPGHPIHDRLAADGSQLDPSDADVLAGPFDMHADADFNDLNFDENGIGV